MDFEEYISELPHEQTAGSPPVSKPPVSAGRVLLVGQGAFAQDVRKLFHRAPITAQFQIVSSYLMALGQASQYKPDLLIGGLTGLGDLARSTARNLKRLLPHCKLVLICKPDELEYAKEAVQAGFDTYLLEPLEPSRLLQLIAPTPDSSTDPSSGNAFDPDIPPVEPGDVDLIEKLLHDQKDMDRVALQIIRSQSGLQGLELIRQGNLPDDKVAVPLRYQNKSFGMLVADPASDTELMASWAGWLSRWFALEARIQGLWKLAMTDPLTGVWNRRYFDLFLKQLLARARKERFRVTLMVFDIDDFKRYNDKYGHPAGDEILTECARLMKAVVRPHDVIARIGGDEFAVIFWDAQGPRRPNSQHPTKVRRIAQRFQQTILSNQFKKLHHEAPGTLTISGGLAGYPWDGRTPEQLLEQADQMALKSKQQGKNALIFGPGADHVEDA